jgi:Zn ribbon nucleic-acid-binding protein
MLSEKIFVCVECGYRREELLKSANQKQESPVVAMFVNGSGRNEHSL